MAPNTTTSRESSSSTHRRISLWFDRALRQSGFSRRPPPPLPSPRPRPITPSNNGLQCHLQTQSPFFTRLPPELRKAILLYAFGNRTIHMQLMLDHPPVDVAEDSSSHDCHRRLARRRDVSAPKQWLWRSCDCHRNPPWLIRQHMYWYMCWNRPELDSCFEGAFSCCCRYWQPSEGRVGVLGWLRSCRWAYEEVIDLLYATNTFHITGQHLLTRLPDYIIPARLARMASFEIVLSLTGSTVSKPTGDDVFLPSSQTLSLCLGMLARCTGIKRLHLCLDCPSMYGKITKVELTQILNAIDQYVRLSEAEATVIQLDRFLIDGLDGKVSTVEKTSSPRGLYTAQLWRCLDGHGGEARLDKRECRYPEVLAPLKNAVAPELGQSRGYWIVESENHRMPPIICCFGTK